jgi:hypothetical protein
MNEFTESKDGGTTLKRSIAAVLWRKSGMRSSGPAARRDTDAGRIASSSIDRAIDLEMENRRLQRLVGELLMKNQELRAELAGWESSG